MEQPFLSYVAKGGPTGKWKSFAPFDQLCCGPLQRLEEERLLGSDPNLPSSYAEQSLPLYSAFLVQRFPIHSCSSTLYCIKTIDR